MPDYSKAIIYKMCCKDVNIKEIYIGSTTNFKRRKCCHKSNCINEKSKCYNYNVYQFIRENGGWNNWDMVMIEEYNDCNNKMELHQRERYFLELLGASLNSYIPNRTIEEYYKDNKEQFKEYYIDNKDQIKQYKKEYRENNKEQIKQYYQDNKHKFKEKVKCEICNKEMNKSSLTKHIKTIHK